jgi:UDP-N-acetyl-D-galactosamine dehydrogenase
MNQKIAVIGLGYVGLPLAVNLAKQFDVVGFDIDERRISELQAGKDRTGEVERGDLKTAFDNRFVIGNHESIIKDCMIFIVTVPTPVDGVAPDLRSLKAASLTVARHLKQGAIVVYESTVYPGVTEDICGQILQQESGLKLGEEFFLGYSPERMNPGDKNHTVDKITKVVAGQNNAVTEKLAMIYGALNNGNIYKAPNIKTAEAAKVIENTQRDINIAFINEITMIFAKMGISTHDVLETASTKWNFMNFKPGLVGGHCIGVDPYYLAYCAKQLGHHPEMILSGRRLNNHMPRFIAETVNSLLQTKISYGSQSRILVMGLSFKENVPDLRNTKVLDMIRIFQGMGHHVDVFDPVIDVNEANDLYNLHVFSSWEDVCANLNVQTCGRVNNASIRVASVAKYQCVVGAVAHENFKLLNFEDICGILAEISVIADIKNMWSLNEVPEGISYWKL